MNYFGETDIVINNQPRVELLSKKTLLEIKLKLMSKNYCIIRYKSTKNIENLIHYLLDTMTDQLDSRVSRNYFS